MLVNYLKFAFRTIGRSPTTSFIHVSGLALGTGCVLLIFSVVTYHLGFDNFHYNANRIYRFVTEQHRDNVSYAAAVPPAFAKAFRDDYTFGEKVARICTLRDQLITVQQDGQLGKFREEVSFAEPDFFDIFNFPLVSGGGETILTEPHAAIITERIAKKYFGNESAVGKTFRFNNSIDFTVTAVLSNIPDKTDFRSEVYLAYAAIKQYNEWYGADDAWGGIDTNIQSFVRLRPSVSPSEVEAILPGYVKKYRAESKNVHHYKLQPLHDVHFNLKYDGRMPKTVLWVLSFVGFVLIFTACLNFVNLATAQAVNRSKEVGIRKTLGSARAQLFWQFTSETALIVIIATALGYAISFAAVPHLNDWFNSRISVDFFSDVRFPLFTMVLIAGVTFVSALYPGIILSAFKPISALRGNVSNQGSANFNVRRALITTQFVISQILLIGLIVVFYQMSYLTKTDPGFDKEGVVMIPVGSKDEKMKTLQAQFLQLPQVENVSLCFAAPASENRWHTMFQYDNRVEPETFSISFRGADENYLPTFDIDLAAGRNLKPSDTVTEFLVNETLVKRLGLSSAEEILGKNLAVNGWQATVVGVTKDFHDESFRSPINPVFICTSNEHYNTYAVRVNMRNARKTLTALEKRWSAMYPEQVYEYAFLDEQIEEFYRVEGTMVKFVKVFASIALFIGCMGLYGLVSFMSFQKTKEIGIRKVLGGSVAHILWIFGKEFTRLVMLSFFVAAPLGWWVMSRWLELYAYRMNFSLWIFVLELCVIFAIVLLTVGYQSVRSALMNPANSLRTE
jgi:putative ABC transport system permease protein